MNHNAIPININATSAYNNYQNHHNQRHFHRQPHAYAQESRYSSFTHQPSYSGTSNAMYSSSCPVQYPHATYGFGGGGHHYNHNATHTPHATSHSRSTVPSVLSPGSHLASAMSLSLSLSSAAEFNTPGLSNGLENMASQHAAFYQNINHQPSNQFSMSVALPPSNYAHNMPNAATINRSEQPKRRASRRSNKPNTQVLSFNCTNMIV